MGTILRLLFPSVLILLVLGVALSYAIGPTERKLSILRALSLAAVFSLVATAFAGVANVLKATVYHATPTGEESVRTLLNGLAEGLVPGMVGFAFLAVSWTLVAVGFRRQV
jgi:hypothetical protein